MAALPNAALLIVIFTGVVLGHLTFLGLPYYWDEAGYYVPAALDFYHRFTLIPAFTNAHPPLPNVVLGSLWHVFGFSVLVTRLVVCVFAALSLLAIFRLTESLLDAQAALTVTILTAVFPIWFVQSTLAHADMFAAAFTLWAFALYFPQQRTAGESERSSGPRYFAVSILFSLAALSKETAIIQPAALACVHLMRCFTRNGGAREKQTNLRWLIALSAPLIPLLAWYIYHRARTGFTFGNPEYLRYNATANFTLSHFLWALAFRFLHLFWQRNIWVPIVMALLCLAVSSRSRGRGRGSVEDMWPWLAIAVAANWVAFSVLGGALLTRYLLPVYPLLLIGCVVVWRQRSQSSVPFATLTFCVFLAGLWCSPPYAFTPEDNLTYRDMIVVHHDAISFLQKNFPQATVLTSFPGAGELKRPELGYTTERFSTVEIENFSRTSIAAIATQPQRYDTAFVFTTQYRPPALLRDLFAHPDTKRAKKFDNVRDLRPEEIASALGGSVVFQEARNGEWAGIIRFPRRYDAQVGMVPLH